MAKAPKRSISEAGAFLGKLWPELPDGCRLLVWTLGEKRSYWCETPTLAAVTAADLGRREQVYLGVGAAGEDYGPTHRAKAAEVVAIPGLVADLDLDVEGRKKPNLFGDRDEIHDFLGSLPLAPSVLVESGGGIQAWWLWEEPWFFDEPREREEAEALSRGWSRFLQAEAKSRGRSVDAVGDLARVMRIPGTVNHKYGRRVEMVSSDGPRYNPDDFELWRSAGRAAVVEVGELVLHPDAHPPWRKFHALMELEPTFRVTWERKRRDLSDQSASGYSLSLATQAAVAGWEDQEIVDLVIAWRALHGADLKLRQDWYRSTLGRALRHREAEQAVHEVETLLDEAHETLSPAERTEVATTVPPVDDDQRKKILELIRQRTGAPVSRVIRHGGDEGRFSLILDGGIEILVGGVRELMAWGTWNEISMLHGRLKQRPKAKAWSDMLSGVQAILEIREAEDASELSSIRLWLEEYLQGAIKTGGQAKERFSALSNSDPIAEDGRFAFSLEAFRGWVRMTKRETIHRGTLRFQLTQLGCQSQALTAREGEQVVHRRYLELGSVTGVTGV